MDFKMKKTYANRLAGIKSVFSKTIADSQAMVKEMDVDISSMHKQVMAIEKDMDAIKETKHESLRFIEKLTELTK